MTDILYLYSSRIHEFIFSFWNAFTCPYTFNYAAWLEMGRGQQVQSKHMLLFFFPWGSTERIEVIELALFSPAELWKNTPCVLLVNSGPNPKSFEFSDRLECPRSESSAVASRSYDAARGIVCLSPLVWVRYSLMQEFRPRQVQQSTVQKDQKSWRFSSKESTRIGGFIAQFLLQLPKMPSIYARCQLSKDLSFLEGT